MTMARSAGIVALVAVAAGCAAPGGPYAGAPVESRVVEPEPAPPPPPEVEVYALPEQEPILPRAYGGSLEGPATTPAPAPRVAPAPGAAPGQFSSQGNAAVVALLDSANAYVRDGELDKASQALERAINIEPRNASLWHDLGQIRLHQREFEQAEALASKSNSLAGDDGGLKARNWRLIAAARRAMGETLEADAAEAQASLQGRSGG